MPSKNKLADNVAFTISENTTSANWFSNIDLEYADSQKSLSELPSLLRNFSIVGHSIYCQYIPLQNKVLWFGRHAE